MERTNQPARERAAFTLIELLVVIAIIAILIGLLVPAVQKVRDSAARFQCQNNLKQLGLGMHSYHGTFKAFPPGSPSGGAFMASWAVTMLPFIDQEPMYGQLVLTNPFYSVAVTTTPIQNVATLKAFAVNVYVCPASPLPVFICPEDLKDWPTYANYWGDHIQAGNYVGIMGAVNGPLDPTEPGTGLGSTRITTVPSPYSSMMPAQYNFGGYLAKNGVLFRGSRVRATDISDGTSNTMMIGEQSDYGVDPGVDPSATVRPRHDIRQTYRAGLWAGDAGTEGTSCITVRYRINTKTRVNYSDGIARYGWNTPIQSAHPGGAFLLRCDGGVYFATTSTSFDILKYLCARDDGKSFDLD